MNSHYFLAKLPQGTFVAVFKSEESTPLVGLILKIKDLMANAGYEISMISADQIEKLSAERAEELTASNKPSVFSNDSALFKV